MEARGMRDIGRGFGGGVGCVCGGAASPLKRPSLAFSFSFAYGKDTSILTSFPATCVALNRWVMGRTWVGNGWCVRVCMCARLWVVF